MQLLQTFAPALAAAQADPARCSRGSRSRTPRAACCRRISRRSIGRPAAAFPFTADDIEAAHARWTADWLAWERAHDAEFKLKAAVAGTRARRVGRVAGAARELDAVEREKLDIYQRRYEEYVRIAKALQALTRSS